MRISAKALLVLAAIGALSILNLEAVPCDSPWTVGPSCSEIIEWLEIQNN